MQLSKSIKIWSLILVTSLFVSCAWLKPDVITETVYLDREIPIVEMPKPLNLVVPRIYAVSYKNLKEFLADNETRNGTIVFIAMDVIDYEVFAHNLAETRRYINQQGAIIEYYEAQAGSGESDRDNSDEPSETAQKFED